LRHNFIVPCHFNLTHLMLHNYIMYVCSNLEAIWVKEGNWDFHALTKLFNLTHLLLHNYIMYICSNLEAIRVKEGN
jgi:hypothetical protein